MSIVRTIEKARAGRHAHTTGRVSRYLKLTVWTMELFFSRVSSISSFLKKLKLPKRKGISNANVESPLACGSPYAATSTWWDLVFLEWVPWDGPLGVGFCAGLLSVPENRARFSYSGFGQV
uniref:Uncharacterized protein n=1 Tax=Vespula pensylvanica TaxID=30213 RepID=A0A834P068_VESPE|nr:hypothetical protein H0235_008567 [Vespula pensylvanica]